MMKTSPSPIPAKKKKLSRQNLVPLLCRLPLLSLVNSVNRDALFIMRILNPVVDTLRCSAGIDNTQKHLSLHCYPYTIMLSSAVRSSTLRLIVKGPLRSSPVATNRCMTTIGDKMKKKVRPQGSSCPRHHVLLLRRRRR
jgi:hypothetical protein